MGTWSTRTTGRRRRRPVFRAGLRRHDGGTDRPTRGRHQEHVLPVFPRQARAAVRRQETLSNLLAEGIRQAPADAGPLRAVAAGLQRASSALGPANRELGPRIKAAIDSSVELQERAAFKNVGLAAAMTTALLERGVAEATAQVASELGVLALKRGYAAWSEGGRQAGDELAPHAIAALNELRAASVAL